MIARYLTLPWSCKASQNLLTLVFHSTRYADARERILDDLAASIGEGVVDEEVLPVLDAINADKRYVHDLIVRGAHPAHGGPAARRQGRLPVVGAGTRPWSRGWHGDSSSNGGERHAVLHGPAVHLPRAGDGPRAAVACATSATSAGSSTPPSAPWRLDSEGAPTVIVVELSGTESMDVPLGEAGRLRSWTRDTSGSSWSGANLMLDGARGREAYARLMRACMARRERFLNAAPPYPRIVVDAVISRPHRLGLASPSSSSQAGRTRTRLVDNLGVAVMGLAGFGLMEAQLYEAWAQTPGTSSHGPRDGPLHVLPHPGLPRVPRREGQLPWIGLLG